MSGERLDERVLALGLAETRSQAQGLIRAGRVLVDDTPQDKPGTRVRADAEIRVRGETRRFVSRGGEKLAGALADLGIDPAGLRCLDVGASTGGFTDCLLQAGAGHVTAVDVGYGQLDGRLRNDPRVHVVDRTNARELPAEALPGPVALVVMDVSFISSTLVLPRIAALCPNADLLVMVKPQFEVGRERVGKGGVVRDDRDRAEAVAAVREAAAGVGYRCAGEADSQLAGPKGNREVFLWLVPAASESPAGSAT
ncbi:MAG: TlyA family RNA methyltransferase [Myxococcales bacterium]|nr:TlyA family RNA methyltransferase [Myxococcales bacterium]